MKMTVKNSLLIGIAILQSHFWIVLTQEVLKGVNNSPKDDTNSSNNDEPKSADEDNVLQTSLLIFISSSLVSIATSSVLEMSKNNLISHSTHTPYFEGTIQLEDADSDSVLHISNIYSSFIDSTSPHQISNFATPHVVDVPTSYLLNSSYLLESYNLLEKSFYLLDNSSNHVFDDTDSYLISPSFVSEGINLSSSYDSYAFIESDLQGTDYAPLSESIIHSPSAESRVLVMTTTDTSPIDFVRRGDTKTLEIQSAKTQSSRTIDSRNEHLSVSFPIKNENSNSKESKPTVSLAEKINTDFSNFFIETSIASSKYESNDDGKNSFSDFLVETASPNDFSSFEVIPPILRTESVTVNSNLTIGSAEDLNEMNNAYSHEIITDDTELKNKTSRNEDPEIDEIISGIIHLLAGNVQVVRPTKHGYGLNPSRLHLPIQPSLVSTRINNRGPIRPNTFSRTVVVFSQPPNGPPTELALPGHLLPSTLQNGQFIRIIPTKVGEHPPSAVSVIHFFNQGPNPLHPQQIPLPNLRPQVPFRGEIFNSNNRLNNKIRIPGHVDDYLRPTFVNPEKQHITNANPGNKYQHFIFSDEAASSVVVLRPSKPPLIETFSNVSPETSTKGNSSYENLPSQNFEVLIDDTQKKNIFVSQANAVSPNSFNNFKQKVSSSTFISSNTLIFPTRTKDIFPHGPVTDWVPFAERPSIREKINETDVLEADANVSIIMNPIIFDITVGSSLNNKIENSKNSTTESQTFPSTSIQITEHLISQPSTNLGTNIISISEIEPTVLNTKVFSNKHLQSHVSSSDSESKLKIAAQVPEIGLISSTTSTDLFPISSIDITPTYDIRDFSTKDLTTSSNSDLSSSHNHKSFFTEKRAFLENTEITEFPTSSPTLDSTTSIKSISVTTSSSISEQTLLGRPIVIPVDIEEVRPYAGPIGPNSDRNKGNPYLGPFTKAEGSTTEDTVRKITSTTTTRTPIIRSQARPRPNTVRIDTCIVGDDSTCDITLNETCKTETGISSCHCRPGYARSYARGPCIPIVSLMLSMKVDRFGNKKVAFSPKYLDKNSEEYRIMEFEAKIALTSLISQIPAFARTFLGMNVNTFYPIGEKLVINSTIFLEEKESTRTQAIRLRLRQLIGEAIRNKKQNIGDSRLYVEGSFSPVTAIEDVNECSDSNLNDCSEEGMCFNVFGTYLCKCRTGYVDPFVHDERRSGRKCSACSPEYCSFHGKCFVERDKRLCKCHGNYIGSRCEIDGEVLGVALGASLAAIIIILLTLGCLCIWNRKWKQQQQKAEVLSSRSYNSNPAFSYMGNVMNGSANPYHLTMEDRMRWAQISDVIKNISVQPNPELPYLSPTPAPLDQQGFPNRCQQSDDEISWYDGRSRPRSRVMGQYGAGPTCFEMDIAGRGPFPAPSSYHSSKRHKHQGMRY